MTGSGRAGKNRIQSRSKREVSAIASHSASQIGSLPATEPKLGPGYEPLARTVTRHLREAIFDGRLRSGDRLGQEAIARELGTSRIPVREALRELESEGLVTIVPHSGARVARLDFAECIEIYKIRERLEPLALAESAGRLRADQLLALRQLAGTIERWKDDPSRWLEADRRFHLACYAGAPLPRLLRAIESFWSTTQQYRRILLSTFAREDYELFESEHRLIVDSLERADAQTGEALVRAHIARSRERLTRNRELFDS